MAAISRGRMNIPGRLDVLLSRHFRGGPDSFGGWLLALQESHRSPSLNRFIANTQVNQAAFLALPLFIEGYYRSHTYQGIIAMPPGHLGKGPAAAGWQSRNRHFC